MYKVVELFRDTDGTVYNVGDTYPQEGKEVNEGRFDVLATTENKYNKVFIEKVEAKKTRRKKVE